MGAMPRRSRRRPYSEPHPELDVEGVGNPPDYRELMQRIVAIHRRAVADPDRPLVALPPAPR